MPGSMQELTHAQTHTHKNQGMALDKPPIKKLKKGNGQSARDAQCRN